MTTVGKDRSPGRDALAGRLAELTAVESAVRLKCELLAGGVQVDHHVVAQRGYLNTTRWHLYDYGLARPSYEIPYEVILGRVASLGGLPVIARVRFNPAAKWRLTLDRGSEFLRNDDTGEECAVELPAISDFAGHEIQGRDLATIVQRLGYDLLGLVPTNYCSYYTANEKCAFCEIVETHRDESPGVSYRKPQGLLIDATEMAASLDPEITSVTYNGGQLADADATVRMYINIVRGIRERKGTSALNATIACMPPDNLALLDELHAAGLNQFFINVETDNENLLRTLAPAKHRVGLARMREAMQHARQSFGTGRVYTNLVYGVQSLPEAKPPTNWSWAEENGAALAAIDRVIEQRIVPTFTVYHSSGRNSTGRIPLSGEGLSDFTARYGQAVWSSGLIDRARRAILFSIGSLPNTTYNDGWLLAELKGRCLE